MNLVTHLFVSLLNVSVLINEATLLSPLLNESVFFKRIGLMINSVTHSLLSMVNEFVFLN